MLKDVVSIAMFFGFIALVFALFIAWYVTIGYVIYHFITKFW